MAGTCDVQASKSSETPSPFSTNLVSLDHFLMSLSESSVISYSVRHARGFSRLALFFLFIYYYFFLKVIYNSLLRIHFYI